MKSLITIFLKSVSLFFVIFLIWCLFLFRGHLTFLNLLQEAVGPAVFTSLCLTLVHFVLAKRKGVHSNYSAHQVAEFNVLENDIHLPRIAEVVSKNKKWKIVSSAIDKVVLKTSFDSMYSFGEIITLVKDKNILKITSTPILPTTLFDFGKGTRIFSI